MSQRYQRAAACPAESRSGNTREGSNDPQDILVNGRRRVGVLRTDGFEAALMACQAMHARLIRR
jgi:hypothetical protein